MFVSGLAGEGFRVGVGVGKTENFGGCACGFECVGLVCIFLGDGVEKGYSLGDGPFFLEEKILLL